MNLRLLSRLGLPGLLALSANAAALEIVIDRGVENALPIAIVPFMPLAGASVEGAPRAAGDAWDERDPARAIADDLRYSGLFAPIPVADLPQLPRRYPEVRFADWRRLGVENLLIGSLAPGAGEDGLSIEFHLIDVYKESRIIGMRLPVQSGRLRQAAHRVSDIVYEQLTGERGAFSTRIAYVADAGAGAGNRRYTLRVADYDGHDPRVLLASPAPLLSLAWSPDGGRIAYASFEGSGSSIYLQDVATGIRRRVSAAPGINSAPRFSPDGKRLCMTLSKDGNPEVYILHVESALLQRVTDHPAIDTEPAWSPDGERLIFTSDRSGSPQIYEIELAGGVIRRLTFEGKYNARAEYSPGDGRYLVLVHGIEGGEHLIALHDRVSGRLTALADSRMGESPGFAPNGQLLLYAADGGLHTIPLNGEPRRRLSAGPGDLRAPAWAPFMR